MKITRLATALTLSFFAATSQAAVYRVVELPLAEEGVNHFAESINNGGEMTATVTNPFNPLIDVSLINFDNDQLAEILTDVNAAQAGNINNDDLVILTNFIQANTGSGLFQQIATNQAYVFDNDTVSEVRGLDVIDPDIGGYTRSADTVAHAINDDSVIVGTGGAPFYKVQYRDENGDRVTYVVRDFGVRGFVQLRDRIVDIPPVTEVTGGVTEAFAVNDSLEVAGYSTTEVTDFFEQAVEDCDDEDLRGDVPLEACIGAILAASDNPQSPLRLDINFQRRAMIWQMDSSGNIIDERELALLATPDSSDSRIFTSIAFSINDAGIAVGTSDTFFRGLETDVRPVATVFDGNEAFSFIDEDEYLLSSANDINNSDFVVGSALTTINGNRRNRFFVHDYRGEQTVFPDGFFESSDSVARAINDDGIVVGDAEIDSNLAPVRRRAGFIYDVNTESFQNINELLSCDSPYSVVQANDINEEGEIAATAVIFRERRNIAGDEDLDDTGNVIRENMSVAVKLIPIQGGTVDDCRVNPETFERQGAGIGYLTLLLLGAFGWVRRVCRR